MSRSHSGLGQTFEVREHSSPTKPPKARRLDPRSNGTGVGTRRRNISMGSFPKSSMGSRLGEGGGSECLGVKETRSADDVRGHQGDEKLS